MCLQPLSIRNPTKTIHIGGGQLLKMQVPCGTCADCLQAKRNEWYVRTHYEIDRTLSLGGYVYFDTLTYADEHLPKLSHFIDVKKYGIADFSCFSHEHFKLFLKRLRRAIERKYRIKRDAFRYFLTSEYGEDDRYTHRPHYHILFFIYFDIPPLEFSQLVAECWQYGRTDGLPFKPSTYVYQHIYGRKQKFTNLNSKDDKQSYLCSLDGKDNANFKTLSSVCMYVSKYITKSSKFAQNLQKRLAVLEIKLNDDEKLKELKRKIDMFHRQSQGFGLSYLSNLTPEKLMFIDDNKVIMKDSDKISKTYPLPMYFRRHLFYTLEQRVDKTRYWQLTPQGVEHFINTKLKSVDKQVLRYMDIIRNCTNEDLKHMFFKMLGNRDISDLVVYEQFYKGRHRHIQAYDHTINLQNNELTDEEINLFDWLLSLRSSACPYSNNADNLPRVESTVVKVTQVVRPEEAIELGSSIHLADHSYLFQTSPTIDVVENIDFDRYVKQLCFDQHSCTVFKHFDDLANVLAEMTKHQRENKELTFQFLEDLKERYKTIFKKTL